MALFDSDYEGATKNVNKVAGENTYENAYKNASSGASGIGQSVGSSVANEGKNVGLTKGQAESLAQGVANEQSKSSLMNEMNRSKEEQQRRLQEAENKAAEEMEKQRQEDEIASTIGTGMQTVGTSAATAWNPMVGIGLGALASAIRGGASAMKTKGGGWRKAGNIIDTLVSDERCKYKTKIHDDRLLHLLKK